MPAIGSSSKKQRRLHGERAAKLDALLQAVGQLADRRAADVLDFEEVDDLLDLLAVLDLFVAAPARATASARTGCASSCTERPAMMLSSVDMPLNRATFWKVRAMPWRTA